MHQISFAAKFILYSDASLNPFVYFLLNDRYRQGLRNILICREILPREVELQARHIVYIILIFCYNSWCK